jgi:hypothetical protein
VTRAYLDFTKRQEKLSAMNKFFYIVLSNGQNNITLSYKLNLSQVTDIWSKMIVNVQPKDIRPNSTPWRGITKDWNAKIHELENLIDQINLWIPDKIQTKWNHEDDNESLNRLHIHFPDLEKAERDIHRLSQLTYYNDLIHEIQSLYNIKIRGREFMQLIVCPESDIKQVDIPETCYKEFYHQYKFGDIFLHHCHVGRHPFEIFVAKDVNCPRHQIIPQHSIYTNFALKFFELQFDYAKFRDFYYESKLEWPYLLDDDRLAFGYIKMGELDTVDNEQYFSRSEVYERVRNCDRILTWGIVE